MGHRFTDFLEVTRQLSRSDAQLIESLEQLRKALAASYRDQNDKEAERIAKIKTNTFCLALGVRDQIAEMLDEMRCEALEVARSVNE